MIAGSGMIDVGQKEKTRRSAAAEVFVRLPEDLLEKIKRNNIPKGNVLEAARLAGIMAAKKTPELIPLCHNIEIDCVDLEFVFEKEGLKIQSRVKSFACTGVEMEAMTACAAGALTVYDMCKMFTKSIEITNLYLLEKKGGKSGEYRRT